MPEERRVQAQARLGGRRRSRGSSGASGWLVLGIVLLAASLVAIGATVVLSSLGAGLPGGARTPGPTPTAPRATTGVLTVGRQDQPAGGEPTPSTATPGSDGAGRAPVVIQTPSTGPGQPLINPQPPVVTG